MYGIKYLPINFTFSFPKCLLKCRLYLKQKSILDEQNGDNMSIVAILISTFKLSNVLNYEFQTATVLLSSICRKYVSFMHSASNNSISKFQVVMSNIQITFTRSNFYPSVIYHFLLDQRCTHRSLHLIFTFCH